MSDMTFLNGLGVLGLTALAIGAAGHALLHKSDSRSALGWVAICLVFPFAGPALYLLFGINRVRRSAARMRREIEDLTISCPLPDAPSRDNAVHCALLHAVYRRLERVGRHILGVDLTGGNCIQPLFNGDEAYPEMLAAIRRARHSVYLATYILDTDDTGRAFIAALRGAVQRGVEVRVLIDGMGEKYSWPRASTMLRSQGVPAALFIPPSLLPPEIHMNMRNHRKILVVDGSTGFTGGMNISARHVLGRRPSAPATDLHFMLRGPVVEQLQDAFTDDWFFATHERLEPPVAEEEPAGDCLCRTVVDGPDCSPEPLHSLLVSIISAASDSIAIMTPYFLPSRAMIQALKSARHRGVYVRIILPDRNNIPFIHWATRHILDDLLQAGIVIAYQPQPFCHTKLMLVDEGYVHLGSANLDNRSLRLNFELTLEVFDQELFQTLHDHFEDTLELSRPVTRQELRNRPLPVRLRDAFFWLFSPYL